MAGSSEDNNSKTRDFICGVVEGFYGRPWTTEQRKDLFQKLKKWGMDSYVYAPKDDYKHRAYWRELYTVEEAEHLTSLISAAKAQGIEFYYALSPGLDITYSNQKEIATLKRKLEQVSQFGCTAFALLFDDIEPEMSESDKQIFQSFAHAQVSITNEIHQHLGAPRFLLCPTQYCSTRAVPNVNNSEYLNTLGSKLCQDIDIMWTGPKVISKILSSACIEEITQVLRRRPVIWDNLHANDYDQKRVFLGPYCGRSPELIPLLRGVLTNPNCEYNANFVPIRTLAHWANCSVDAPSNLDAICSDIKLEREGEDGEEDTALPVNKNVYHHRQALRNAISEWLPEFSVPKNAFGPMTKPQPVINVAPAPIIPILPSVNTCMSLTAPTNTTASSTSSATLRTVPSIPSVCTSQLQALADVCAGAGNASGLEGSPAICAGDVGSSENFNPVSNPIMNSLVSPTKVVMNESIPNPIPQIVSSNISVPTEIPLSSIPVPILKTLEVHEKKAEIEDLEADHTMMDDNEGDSGMGTSNGLINSTLGLSSDSYASHNDSKKDDTETDSDTIIVDDIDLTSNTQLHNGMSVESGEVPMSPADLPSDTPLHTEDDVVMNDTLSESGSMQVEAASPLGSDMMTEHSDTADNASDNNLTLEDLNLLCDLFYLPFEHGSRALRLLQDFNWLISHAASLLAEGHKTKTKEERQEVGARGKEKDVEAVEWRRRSSRFLSQCSAVSRLERRLARCRNRELTHDLYTYAFDLRGVVDLLTGYVKWLGLAKFPANVNSHMQASYTWFSKGWREAFESGDQEPWVFRGGLTADLRRLVAVECGGAEVSSRAAASNAVPLAPPTVQYTLRPYNCLDEKQVCTICHKTCRDGTDCTDLFPNDLQTLPADRLVSPFLNLTPEFCMVVEDSEDSIQSREEEIQNGDGRLENGRNAKGPVQKTLVGYACAALDSREFYRNQEMAWIPEMCEKYPMEMIEGRDLSTVAKESIQHFHKFKYWLPDNIHKQHPSIVTCSVLAQCQDASVPARLLTCLLAALRANGSSGVHVCINSTDHYMHQFYTKLGFLQLAQEAIDNRLYLGRTF